MHRRRWKSWSSTRAIKVAHNKRLASQASSYDQVRIMTRRPQPRKRGVIGCLRTAKVARARRPVPRPDEAVDTPNGFKKSRFGMLEFPG